MSEQIRASFFEKNEPFALTIWYDASGYVPAIGDYVIVTTPEGQRTLGVISRTWQRANDGIDCNLIVTPIEKIRERGA